MRLPWSRPPLPDDVKTAVQLQRGEIVRAAVEVQDGGYAVATDQALHLLLPQEDEQWRDHRVRWDLIDNVNWSPPALALDMRRDTESAAETIVLEFDHRSDMPAVVRNRVTDSIVVNNQIDVGRSWVRVVARRVFETGDMDWRVVPGPGVDPQKPEVAAAIETALRDARSQWQM